MLCGRLWHAQCRAASTDLPSELPVSFQSAGHYISAYEALIFEEAREAVLHSRLDQHSTDTPATVLRSAWDWPETVALPCVGFCTVVYKPPPTAGDR